jgi:hypothetical protein
MSPLIAAVVVYGFSHIVDRNLIHARLPRPVIPVSACGRISLIGSLFIFQWRW